MKKFKCLGVLLLTLSVVEVRGCNYASSQGKLYTSPATIRFRFLSVSSHSLAGHYLLCLQSVNTVEVGQNTSLFFNVQ